MAVPGKKMPKRFSSSSTLGSDEDLEVYCQPCDRDGPRLPAHGFCVDCREHLCETCFTFHKRHTLSRHHTLLDKNSMPQSISSVSVHPTQPDNFTKSCPKHKKEFIKFYCQNHKALLCSVCVALEHTGTSCKVNYIPDISGQVINSKELRDILKTMDTITEQCRKKSEDLKKNTAKSNNSLTDILTDIKKFRKEINQKLDELERQAEDASKTILQENNKNLRAVETTCDDVTKSLKTSSDSIEHLNTSKQADKLFMELKLAEQMIKDHEKRVHHLATCDVKEYNFKENKAISTLLNKERSLGTFAEKSLKQPSPPPCVDIKSGQTSHQDNPQDPNAAAWAAYYAQYYIQYGQQGQQYPGQQPQPPQQPIPRSQQQPGINPQTGQPDYSQAWAEYYRQQGMFQQANAILAQHQQQQGSSGQAQGEQPPQQLQSFMKR